MANKLENKKPSDLKNWAYETIKRTILNAEVNAGDQLRIELLAGKLGTSRTPIREALLKLESEGLVHAASRVGFFVRGLSKKDLRELFELREILEGFAAEKATMLIEEHDLQRLKECQIQAKQAIDAKNVSDFMEMEVEIHSLILRKAGNNRLVKMIDSIKDLIQRERIMSLKSSENIIESFNEHQQIVAAVAEKDSRLAGMTMRSHIVAVKERLLAFLELPEE